MVLASIAVLALLFAAAPADRAGVAEVAWAPLPALDVLLPEAMTPPPDVVVRTLATYGSVRIDHKMHLAARAACARCHGQGRAGKLELGARVGHARCISCHTEESRGPTQCTGCHAGGATRGGAAAIAAASNAVTEPEPTAPAPAPETRAPDAEPVNAAGEPAPPQAEPVLTAAEPSPPTPEPAAEPPPPRASPSPAAELPAQPLPSPPGVVVRPLETFGSVTFDHRKHLAARASCARCHGPGRVGKVELGARVAHARCITCHTEVARGPTQCIGCHDRSDVRKGTALAAASQAPAEPPPRATEPVEGAAAGAPRMVPSHTPGAEVADLHERPPVEPRVRRSPDRQLVQLGFDFAPGAGFGGSLRIASRGARREAAYSIARLSDGDRARVLMLFDFGLVRPLANGVSGWVVGTVGFDSQEQPNLGFSPAFGARAGIEWAPPAGFVRSLHLSATGLFAVAHGPTLGDPSGGGSFFLTLAVGLPIPGLPTAAP